MKKLFVLGIALMMVMAWGVAANAYYISVAAATSTSFGQVDFSDSWDAADGDTPWSPTPATSYVTACANDSLGDESVIYDDSHVAGPTVKGTTTLPAWTFYVWTVGTAAPTSLYAFLVDDGAGSGFYGGSLVTRGNWVVTDVTNSSNPVVVDKFSFAAGLAPDGLTGAKAANQAINLGTISTGASRTSPEIFTIAQVAQVTPEPGSMVALFSGLVGLVGYGIRRRK